MTKTMLMNTVADRTDMTRCEVERVIAATAEVLTEAMLSGDSVNIPGFGIFTSKERPAHTGRNPATGESVEIPAKRVAIFKPSKLLKDILKG